ERERERKRERERWRKRARESETEEKTKREKERERGRERSGNRWRGVLMASVKEETSGCMSDYNTTRTQRSSSQLPPLPLGCGPSQEDASTGAAGQHRPHPNNQHTIFLFINEREEDMSQTIMI